MSGRKCGCGCGATILGPTNKIYVDRRHNQRAYRKRLNEAARAVGVETSVSFKQLKLADRTGNGNGDRENGRSRGQARSRSGLQVSLPKAAALIGAELERRRMVKPAGAGRQIAELWLRSALSSLQQQRYDARAYAREEEPRRAA